MKDTKVKRKKIQYTKLSNKKVRVTAKCGIGFLAIFTEKQVQKSCLSAANLAFLHLLC